MYVCICHAVTDKAIRNSAAEGVRTMRQLRQETGCSGSCGQCAPMAKQILDTAQPQPSRPTFSIPVLGNLQPV